MLSNVDILLKTINQKERIINYLKTQYKLEVGEDIEILEDYINNSHSKEEKKELKEFNTFEEKVLSLKLPDPSDKNMKLQLQKLKKQGDTTILIKYLNLSNFKGKNITKDLLKRVSDGLKMLKSVEILDLSNNDINDYYSDEIADFVGIESIKRINLRSNDIGKTTGKKIISVLKNIKTLEFIDLSYNPVCQDEFFCSSICMILKNYENLYHLGLSDTSREAAVKLLFNRKSMRSLNLDDNKYKYKTYEYLSRVLTDKKISLSELSLKFATIDVLSSMYLEKIIKLNRTLIFINLYSVGLNDHSGSLVVSSLISNNTLIELNLGNNFLSNEFCNSFKSSVPYNRMIKIIDISKNKGINYNNFDLILDGLTTNQSIISIGQADDMSIYVKQRENLSNILKFNVDYQNNNDKTNMEEFNKTSKENFLNRKEPELDITKIIKDDIDTFDFDKISFKRVNEENDYFVYA